MKRRFLLVILSFWPLLAGCIASSPDFSSPSIDISSSVDSSPSSSHEEEETNRFFFDASFDGVGDGSKSKPFSSFTSINRLNLKGGEKILLKKGAVFSEQLSLIDIHGSPSNPIIVSSYGEGEMPKIVTNGQSGQGTLYISNCSYLTIQDLEITDSSKEEGDRRGVLINLTNPNENDIKTYSSIHLNNLYIHDIAGISDKENAGMSIESKKTGGILLWSEDGKARSEDFRITNCRIENVSNVGIASFYKLVGRTVTKVSPYDSSFEKIAHKYLLVENNEISYVAKNAIFLRNAYDSKIRNNIVHDTAIVCKAGNAIVTSYVDEIVVEGNEGYRNMASVQENGVLQDGAMLDPDLQSKKVTFQYNYSHDNSFGLFLNCNAANKDDPGAKDEIVLRYNVSINDYGQKGLVYINYFVGKIDCYNNTFLSNFLSSPTLLEIKNDRNLNFYNNLIYSSSTSPKVALGNQSGVTINNNVFYSENTIDGMPSLENNFSFNPNPKVLCGDNIEERIGYEQAKKYILMKNENLFKKENCITIPSSPKDFLGHVYQESIGAVNSL